jgi:hypothetical protein
MSNRRTDLRTGALLLLAMLASVAGSAQPEPAVLEVITAGSLTLQPRVDWNRATLTVGVAGGLPTEHNFYAPEAIAFYGLDASGHPLTDGLYGYELRLTAIGPADRSGVTHSGRFRIAEGTLQAAPGEGAPEEVADGPTEPRLVEDHTTGDRGTSQDICAGCSSGFEPGSAAYGRERLTIIDGTYGPGIDFLRSESADHLEEFGWELGMFGSESSFYLGDLGSDGQTDFYPIQIENNTPNWTLYLASGGKVGIGTRFPSSRLHVAGSGGEVMLVDGGAMAVRRDDGLSPNIIFDDGTSAYRFLLSTGNGAFNIFENATGVAPLRMFPGNTSGTLVMRDSNLGIRKADPAHPIHAYNGGRLTAGGAWLNGSSRELKRDIERLSTEEALEALAGLDPVKFAYKAEPADRHVGFIAEDVPELVSSPDRKALGAMDVVAVLTKVVQEQQAQIEEQKRVARQQRAQIVELRELLAKR